MAFSTVLLTVVAPFDWERFWLSEEAPASFLLEIVVRCVLMFLLTIGALRISGKRGVRQLSLFEFALLLVPGSARPRSCLSSCGSTRSGTWAKCAASISRPLAR